MQFDLITIFPNSFDSYLNESIIKRALSKRLIAIDFHNPRDLTTDKHHTVDDRPYGGGPGMILMAEPIVKTISKIKKKRKHRVVMLTPAGKQFTQREAERLAKYDQLIFLCGRYEGFDSRIDKYVDEKISIGPYVLSGGELPAMVVIEAVSRHVKGVLGHDQALADETFSHGLDYVEYPQYTRPENYKGMKVPKVLLSVNHAKIEKWRHTASKRRT
jgi:tRNA (guanine37-N1)-methyltransferase